jgi:hypothetical protein
LFIAASLWQNQNDPRQQQGEDAKALEPAKKQLRDVGMKVLWTPHRMSPPPNLSQTGVNLN